ncbi:hypothetical protein [Actinoplanes sp. NPDC049599]|uniref:hypothetical protein n=1 Tax=Actinoplanes sp. NPDC049599 TaxID=3363903 RepID=UPI0037A5B954
MIDPLSLAVGALIALAGFVAGRVTHRRPETPQPQAICGCGHGLGQHDNSGERCHAEIGRPVHNKHGEVIGQQYVPCTCRRYVGPLPIEQFLRTELLPPT